MVDSGTYTPEAIARRLEIAKGLMADQPIKHWAQGLNELAKGYLGGSLFSKAEGAETTGKQAQYAALAGLLGGGETPIVPSMPVTQTSLPPPAQTATPVASQPDIPDQPKQYVSAEGVNLPPPMPKLYNIPEDSYKQDTFRMPLNDPNMRPPQADITAAFRAQAGLPPVDQIPPNATQTALPPQANTATQAAVPQTPNIPIPAAQNVNTQAPPTGAPGNDVRGKIAAMLRDPNPYVRMQGAQIAQAAIGPMLQPPKFGVIGKGIGGEERYGWINPANQSITPLSGAQAGNTTVDNQGNQLEGPALLEHLKKTDPTAAAMVQAIIRGDASVTGRNLQKYMPYATLVDPTLSQFNYDTRKKTALDFAPSGKSAMNVKSLETVGGHLDKMADLFDKMGNTKLPIWNTVRNVTGTATGGGAPTAFETVANGVANELGTVFRSAGMSDAEVKSWRDRISTSASPEQFNAAMGTLLDMLKTRKEAIQEQYRQGLGKEPPPQMFGKLEAAIEKIQSRVSGLETPKATSGPANVVKSGSYRYDPSTGQIVPQ